jgi:alkylation response protein AidB-like acyl-CoA dehydrogenase
MDLELTDEQKLLSTSIETLLERSGADAGETWEKIVEFGGLMVGEEALGAVELCLIARNLGAHLAAVPYLGSAAARYAVEGTPDLPAAFAALAEEPTAIAVAFLEPGGSWSVEALSTRLADRVLAGEKCTVEAAGVDELLVVARDDDGPALALVPLDAAGVEVTAQESIDSSIPLSRVSLAGVAIDADRVLSGTAAAAAIERLEEIGGLLAAAEVNGAGGTILAQAAEYAGQRRQFGRTIGSNQALRHLLADMYVREAAAWSSILYSAAALDDGAAEARRSTSITKAFASQAGREVAHGAMQVFGGIAFTEEHDAHRFLRRINLRGSQFGDAAHHERLLGGELAGGARRVTAA